MSCCESNCGPSPCASTDENGIEMCSDNHLAPFCPPPCNQCFTFNGCGPESSSCGPTLLNCEPNALNCLSRTCTSKPNPCSNFSQLVKHVSKCPPKCPPMAGKCKSLTRASFKPVVNCVMTDPCATMCYQTNYMRSYTTTTCCCTSNVQ